MRADDGVFLSLLTSGAIAAGWLGWLMWRRGAAVSAVVVVRRPHWVQAIAHSSIYAYWGHYVPLVYHEVPLICAQVVFAYVLDLLMSWSRGRRWVIGFGPIPIIGSVNLFLWFKDPWFGWQLTLVALAFLSREFFRRTDADGNSGHIFNPSGFGLTAVSIMVIAMGQTDMTWGPEIATTLVRAPYIFECLFAVGVVIQLLFGVCLVTMSAATSVVLIGLVYTAATGDYFFENSTIPVAVFLGMHLLITDPVTSPRDSVGKAVFGLLYGLAVFPLFVGLAAIGTPSFYDKLLQVPLLNLAVPWIERLTGRFRMPGPWADWSPVAVNRLHVGIWCGVFLLMRPALVDHPGQQPGHWVPRCEAGDTRACQNLTTLLSTGCHGGASPESCLLLADMHREGRGLARSDAAALRWYTLACETGGGRGCAMAAVATETGKAGATSDPARAAALRERACELGDAEACTTAARRLVDGQGVARDPARAAALLEGACTRGLASPCAVLGFMLERGQGIPPNRPRALELYGRACDLGLEAGCRQIDGLR